ncbi:MAG: hypothetical protein KDA24_15945 [Deltaproteobacteria bacterium]|nr:hypothetical protein [Deltaproteobacteria bacterium]
MTADSQPKRPLMHPTNVRFVVMVVLIALVVFVSNMCSQSATVRGVVGADAITRLPSDVAQVKASVEALDSAISRVSSQVVALDGQVKRLTSMEQRVVYTHDPAVSPEPDGAALDVLRNLVAAGAEIRVVHRPEGAKGPVKNFVCANATVDENGSVLCTGPVIAANMSLPDGRRYQETVRHDGTVLLAHWDANGGNVQGSKEIARYAVTFLARGPIR